MTGSKVSRGPKQEKVRKPCNVFHETVHEVEDISAPGPWKLALFACLFVSIKMTTGLYRERSKTFNNFNRLSTMA